MTSASLSSHVLDLQSGKPAAGLAVTLFALAPSRQLATGVTDADGRIRQWTPAVELVPGTYELEFATGSWFAAREQATLYPRVLITFAIAGAESHYHIPLLLSPYGYSTYRGS